MRSSRSSKTRGLGAIHGERHGEMVEGGDPGLHDATATGDPLRQETCFLSPKGRLGSEAGVVMVGSVLG